MSRHHLIIQDVQHLHPGYRHKLLKWAQAFGSFCFLDNQEYQSILHRHNFLAGVGKVDAVSISSEGDFKALDSFLKANKGKWIFGHLSYDLFSMLHGIVSHKKNLIGFSLIEFFVPEFVFKVDQNSLAIITQGQEGNALECWESIVSTSVGVEPTTQSRYAMIPRQSRESYLEAIGLLKKHILLGDCYEVNYCQEFFAENVPAEPIQLYENLIKASPNPFSCFYKQADSFLICASPERFLTRRKNRLSSQPIKGTAPRDLSNPQADQLHKEILLKSEKERSENVMVVDLVRNDLSRVCQKASVTVDELCGVYSYPQVHQMISTISGLQREDVQFSDLIRALFPMGSMTGAPKLRVMELIEKYEPSARGLFSGGVGYFDPSGDFDFNVVIRSILYNAQERYLSYMVGSGITWYSQPDKEYEECLWKANAIREVLGAK